MPRALRDYRLSRCGVYCMVMVMSHRAGACAIDGGAAERGGTAGHRPGRQHRTPGSPIKCHTNNDMCADQVRQERQRRMHHRRPLRQVSIWCVSLASDHHSFAKRAEFDLVLEVDTRRNVLLNASIKVCDCGAGSHLIECRTCLVALRCPALRRPTPRQTSSPRASRSSPRRSCSNIHSLFETLPLR